VINLAYATAPKASYSDPCSDLLANLPVTVGLLEECLAVGVRRLLLVSSGGTVYGPVQQIPISEAHPTAPISPYGITKLTVEKYLLLARDLYGLRPVILRMANPYGERQRVEGAQGVVAAFLERALAGQAATAPVVEEGAEAAALIQRHPGQSRRRGLPVDADVVEVERRLYRDGTSKYLINGKTARLRDIRELFLDTGIGADAYSIIEQGKVDAMLLASPTERRTIFEEAAGLAKYKQRRIEAQRKLDRAEANLKISREQLENTERRLRIVRGQAAKARKFKELDENLRAWRLALAFEQYDDLRQRLSLFLADSGFPAPDWEA
jgi:hypothetical protein